MADPIPKKKSKCEKKPRSAQFASKPAAVVRGEILQTVDEANALMRSILRGEFKEEIHDRNGVLVGCRNATIKEITAVYRCLAAHALPLRQEVTGRDGGPIQIEAAVERANALDRLDDEELALARRLAERLDAHSDA